MQPSPLELGWTAIMLLGLVNDSRLLRRAVRIARRRRQSGRNGLAKIAVRKHLRGILIRWVLWLSYAIVGLAAISFTPETPQMITFPVTVGGLFVGVLGMLVGALLDTEDARQVDAYADDEHDRRSSD